jgi:DNA-binding response OmpR family regulator
MRELQYVIVADDDADQRELLGLRLRREGFAVETVADGKQLLDLLERAGPSRAPRRAALVISDLMMPACSGWDVLAAMRERHPDVPVLILSAVADLFSRTRALALGARAVLKKPLEWEELRDAVSMALRPAPA